MLNNPIRYTDPSGHETCTDDGYCGNVGSVGYWNWTVSSFQTLYGIEFSGSWTSEDQATAMIAVMDVGDSLSLSANTGQSASDSFRQEFETDDNPLVFTFDPGCSQCGTSDNGDKVGGVTLGSHHIMFASLSPWYFGTRRNNVVHELGHVFNNLHGGYPAGFAGGYAANRANILLYFSNNAMWQLHIPKADDSIGVINSEMFADMFVAWTYDAWNTNPLNADIVNKASDDMNTHMSDWLK